MRISKSFGQSSFPSSQVSYPLALIFCLLASPSCSNSTGGGKDQARLSGSYILERVDGALLPVVVAPQQGCNRTVRVVTLLSLTPQGPDVAPMYDWSIAIDAACQPVPPGVNQGADDVGMWRSHSTDLAFNSMKGRGSYSATLDELPGYPPAVTIVYLGNSYRFRRVDDASANVFVKVVDQNGQLVPGVVLIFTFANGLQGGGTTPASGEFGTGGVVGECKVSITPPAGYEVPASQPNPVSVNVVQGPAVRIQVSLKKL